MRYRISHSMNTDADTYWNQIFFDEEYNDKLFKGYLRFSNHRVLELRKDADGTVHRRVESSPAVELPGALKKVLGDLSSYVEEGVFDPVTKHFHIKVIPSAAADKIKTRVEVWVEPRGAGQSERIVDVDSEVKIFGIGKVAEKFLEQQLRTTYGAAAEFTNRWIAEKGLAP